MLQLADADTLELSASQEAAVVKIMDGSWRALVLTGPAGSGKSTVVKYVMAQDPKRYTIASTTARSALLVGGCTVDSLFCMRRRDWSVWSEEVLEKQMAAAGRVIIIDEASMIGSGMAGVLRAAASRHNKRLLLVGDWAQASPVRDDWPFNTRLFKEAEWAWLRENFRQGDGDFLSALNEVRRGEVSPPTAELLQTRVTMDPPEHAVRLYATNIAVDVYNTKRFEELVQRDTFIAVLPQTSAVNGSVKDFVAENLVKASPLADNTKIAIGCRVMVTYNINTLSGRVVNGDTGDVVDVLYRRPGTAGEIFSASGVIDEANVLRAAEMDPSNKAHLAAHALGPVEVCVRLDRTDAEVYIGRITIKVPTNPQETSFVSLTGYPLRLGYAYTVHKSQGMTIPKVHVDVWSLARFPKDGRHGLAYVALSRVRKLEDLTLSGWVGGAVCLDSDVERYVGGF